jgi:hypothetical protein
MRTVLLFVGVVLGSVLGTFALYVLYAVVDDALSRGEKLVPFSDLVMEVEMGHVEEIAVHGCVYTFKTRDGAGRTTTREARGPAATQAELLAWRPSDAALPAPRVVGP